MLDGRDEHVGRLIVSVRACVCIDPSYSLQSESHLPRLPGRSLRLILPSSPSTKSEIFSVLEGPHGTGHQLRLDSDAEGGWRPDGNLKNTDQRCGLGEIKNDG